MPLDDLGNRQRLLGNFVGVSANLVQDVDREPGLLLVLEGHGVHGRNGIGLAASGQQELGRLVQVEEEETAHEHGERDGAESEDQPTPTLVVFTVAARLGGIIDGIARLKVIIATVGGYEAPGDKTITLKVRGEGDRDD